MLVIVIALPLFALFTAELASTFTVQKMSSSIRRPQDLVNRDVATVKGTTSEQYVRGINARVHAYGKIEDTYQALRDREVDAVVYDAPILCYFVHQERNGELGVVGKIFEPQDYGIAMREGSPLREKINRALLALRENGEFARIRDKWFGGN